MFVTAFCGFFDLDSGALRFCNAGHDRPLILRSDGSVEVQQSRPGLALGVMPRYEYPLQEMRLGSDDALFLYTDGVTEATNPREELFGMERLRAVLAANGRGGSSEVINAVTDAVDAFVEEAPQSDDMTMLCLRYLR
jgi:phosphoserine phosphatase RsbU/P